MDEPAMMRAELARLDEGERKLVKQLSDIRAAAAAQKKRLGELIRARKPSIQRLPVEVLSSVLHFALCGPNPSRKETLSRVSRHWRDTILDQPNFWSTIEIDGRGSSSHVQGHLEKSREAPLDIIIQGDWFNANDTIREGLDLLVPYANRWQSLFINVWTDMPRPVPQFILDCIGATKFPSLRHLKLRLRFRHNHPSPHPMPVFKHIPVLTLVKLSLSGDIPPFLLQSGSVHFPVLEGLSIIVRDTADFFKAIVTPKLKLLNYVTDSENPPSVVFSGLRDKFCSVRQLYFGVARGDLNTLDALALCRAFPRVCHAHFFKLSPLSAFFGHCEGTNDLGSPADYWKCLESLAFDSIDLNEWLVSPIREHNAFVQWLVARHDPRPLRVHIKNVEVKGEDVESFYMLCEILRENCVVEWRASVRGSNRDF